MAIPISQIMSISYEAVLNEMRGKAANQWAESSFMSALEQMGAVKRKSFGPTLEKTLDYKRNESAAFLEYDTSVVPLSKTEVITAASYTPALLSESVVWTKGDEAMNPTQNQKVALSRVLMENAINSHDDVIEQALFSTTTNGFLGLQTIIPDSGQGSVGGVNAALETWWRNHTDTYLDDASDIEAQMTEAYNLAAKGTGSALVPRLLVSGASAHALFESTQQALQRYADSGKAVAGFKSLAFKTANYIFSQYGGTRIYFLNPKSLTLEVSAQYFRDKGETQEIDNAQAFSFKIFSALQLTTDNKSRLAVLTQTAA